MIVESVSYDLEPYDMIIVGKNEFHQVFHNSSSPYHRIVLKLWPKFFTATNCQIYEEYFEKISTDTGHKISGNIVRSSGLYDVFKRYSKYSGDNHNESLVPVINYLNQHYTEEITLGMLQEKFFISKYHLCRIFKKYTGQTIYDYIQKKRLIYARELKEQGISLTKVATMSGFHDYASFYRAYQKEYNTSPKKGLK